MRWKGRRVSQNVEDRRGGAKVGGQRRGRAAIRSGPVSCTDQLQA